MYRIRGTTPRFLAYIAKQHIISMSTLSPDFKGIELTPEDYQFIDFVVSEVTQDGQLPFTLPPMSIPKVIKQSALFFYREAEEATEERWFGIKYEDIIRDGTLNAVLQLPDAIESITEVHSVNKNVANAFGALTKFFREPLFYANSISAGGGLNNIKSYRNNPLERDLAWEESVARLYEFNQFRTMFNKGVRFDYNPLTHKLNFLGRVDSDIVLSTYQRIPLASLYGYDLFQKHVVGSCLERVKMIVNQFNVPYPGDVTINWDSITEMGKDMKEKVEELIRQDSSGADLIIIS